MGVKLTMRIAENIRNSDWSCAELARHYKVSQNTIRRILAGETWKPEGPRKLLGSDVGNSKLTEEKVLEIRKRYAAGETQVALSEIFEVSQPTISHICARITWGHI